MVVIQHFIITLLIVDLNEYCAYTHEHARIHTYTYIYIHVSCVSDFFVLFFYTVGVVVVCIVAASASTVGVVVWIVAASASPVFDFEERDSSLLKLHLWESLWEIDLICLVSIYVIYYLFHVL